MKLGGYTWTGSADNQWKHINVVTLPDGSIGLPISVNTVGVSTATNTKVAVGSSSTSVLVANTDRRFAILVNDSNEDIYIALGATAILNQGIRLNAAGGSLEINSTNLYTGAITAICASGSKNLTVCEG